MKNVRLGPALIAALALTAQVGCDESGTTSAPLEAVIVVSGDQGVRFSGSMGLVGKTSSVDGTVPATYSVLLDSRTVSVSLQKQDATGSMTVEISGRGQVVASGSTSAENGTVTLTHRF